MEPSRELSGQSPPSAAPRHGRSFRGGNAHPDAVAAASSRGDATHRLIAYLAETYGQPTTDQIYRAGLRCCKGRGKAIQTRQAFRIGVISMTGVYFNRFPRPRWRLVDTLAVLSGEENVEVDLVWERGGLFEIDEIKTSQPSDRARRHAAQQIQAQHAAARERWGDRAGVVRAAFLLQPTASFTTDAIPDGLV